MTRTAAQAARIANARKDATAAGTRIVTRTLPSGLVRVTEQDGDTAVSMILNSNGQYVGQTTSVKVAKVAKKTATVKRPSGNQAVKDITAATLFDRMPGEVQHTLLAGLGPDARATLEAGLKRGRALKAKVRAAR